LETSVVKSIGIPDFKPRNTIFIFVFFDDKLMTIQ